LHSNNKTSKKNGTPHNQVRQQLLNFLYDSSCLEIGQEKKCSNCLFLITGIAEHKKDLPFLEISKNISISALSINIKRFCLLETIIIAT
jgi:hypothetical protein